MLYLTTSMEDKAYNRQIVSPKSIIKMLGIEGEFSDKLIHFRIPQSSVKDDPNNEGVKKHVRLLSKNRVDGIYNGQGFTLEYTPYAAVPDKEGKLNISKSHIFAITDPEWWMDTSNTDLEKTLMVYLDPSNTSSPIRASYHNAYYEVYKPSAEAAKALQESRAKRDFVRSLEDAIAKDEMAVRRKAKGLENEFALHSIDELSKEEFEYKLISVAEANVSKFKKAWEDATTAEKGLINDAIDKEVIKLITESGIQYWVWSNNEKICNVPQGSDTRLKIREYFLNNYTTMQPALEKALGSIALDAKSKKK